MEDIVKILVRWDVIDHTGGHQTAGDCLFPSAAKGFGKQVILPSDFHRSNRTFELSVIQRQAFVFYKLKQTVPLNAHVDDRLADVGLRRNDIDMYFNSLSNRFDDRMAPRLTIYQSCRRDAAERIPSDSVMRMVFFMKSSTTP